jgi:Tol biopolymer transport system component
MSADGSDERLVHEEPARMATDLRWSPDGRRLAVPFVLPGANVSDPKLLLVDVESGESRTLQAPRGAGQPIALDWSGDSDTLIYTQSVSQTPIADQNLLVLHHLPSDRSEILTYVEGVPWAIDILGGGRVVVGMDFMRANLQVAGLDGGASRWLTLGDSLDRQPVYSPDGAWVAFSTNRAGNLDVYSMHVASGEVRRLTDHPGTDWDPAFTPDGRRLVFSSDREGHFEIWMAEADGRNPRRITEDGADAENGSVSPDGAWLVYNSAHPERSGVWKRHLETGAEVQLFRGITGVPEISPDGRWVLAVRSSSAVAATIDVVSLEDGAPAPFSIECVAEGSLSSSIFIGRSRWLPDGSGIAFVCQDEAGGAGVFSQDFVPGVDTRSTRRLLAGRHEDRIAESFGFSPDGKSVTLSLLELRQSLMVAENLPGVSRPSAGGSRRD